MILVFHIFINDFLAPSSLLKSTENCVCILHNLTYRIELPEHNGQTLRESQQNLAHKQTSLSCFPSRSAKIAKVIPFTQLSCLTVQNLSMWLNVLVLYDISGERYPRKPFLLIKE